MLSPIQSFGAFCDWQRIRLQQQLTSTAPILSRPHVPAPPAVERWHGTKHGYDFYHCRCASCGGAKTRHEQAYRARKRGEAAAGQRYFRSHRASTHILQQHGSAAWAVHA